MRPVKIHKRLPYYVNVNRTSLDHLLLGNCADVDRTCRMKRIITPLLLRANMGIRYLCVQEANFTFSGLRL